MPLQSAQGPSYRNNLAAALTRTADLTQHSENERRD